MKSQLVLIDQEALSGLISDVQLIKSVVIKNQSNPVQKDDFLTSDEFMKRTKIGRWKFSILISNGLLKYRKIGRKYYIPIDQVRKYFDGEIVIK